MGLLGEHAFGVGVLSMDDLVGYACVMMTSFSILVNGILTGSITHSKRLRQGNPLFSYLFILYTKGPVTMLKQSALNNGLTGIIACQGTLYVNHLLFVDNSLIFCKTNSSSSQQLLDILHQYAKASG